MTVSIERVRDLAVRQAGGPVLSVYLRTDPRELANMAATPGWVIELRNELRDVIRRSHDEERSVQPSGLRDLCERVERDVLALEPSERGRGLAWFLTPDASLDERFTLQSPPQETLVRWDDHPFVSPLVDLVDRGRPTGLVLLSAEAVRLLRWQMGRVDEPERPLYEFELGEWRDYAGYVGHADRSAGGMHVATFSNRIDDWRKRFLSDAASATAKQVADLGWHRLALIGEPRVADAFASRLPTHIRERVVATVDTNLIWEEPAAVAERVEPTLDDAWRRETRTLVEAAVRTAAAGGAAALGWAEVLDCLLQGRVDHLVFAADATPDPDLLAPHIRRALGDPTRLMLVERAVELAVSASAEVSAITGDVALADAGGVAAVLRY